MNYYIYVFQGDDKTKWIARISFSGVRVCDFIFDFFPSREDIIDEYNSKQIVLPLLDSTVRLEYQK